MPGEAEGCLVCEFEVPEVVGTVEGEVVGKVVEMNLHCLVSQ